MDRLQYAWILEIMFNSFFTMGIFWRKKNKSRGRTIFSEVIVCLVDARRCVFVRDT